MPYGILQALYLFPRVHFHNYCSCLCLKTTEDELKFHVAAKFLMKPLKESQDTGKSGFSTKGSDSNSQSCSRKRSNDSTALSGPRKRNRTESPSARSILDCLNAFTRTESITKEYLCMACNEKRCSQGIWIQV